MYGNSTDNSILEIGAMYHLESVEVHSWHTEITLEEFPNKQFGSVLFEEVEIL